MKHKGLIVTLIFAGLTLVGPPLVAQESATIQALATVISSLSISGENNLQFGNVTPGVNKSVDKSQPGFAGEWYITGTPGAEITLDFALPDSLLLVADSANGLRVDFSNTDASFDDGSGGGQLAPAGTLDPNGMGTENLGGTGEMRVWIGGTVYPRISQTGGDYAEDVVLSVAYTGN